MKNRIIGLGIFALVFSLNLLFSGFPEANQASAEPFYAHSEASQQSILSDAAEIKSHDGILQQQTEIIELHHMVRKYPAVLGALFLLLNPNTKDSPAYLRAADLSFLPAKDLPVSYHNLRI